MRFRRLFILLTSTFLPMCLVASPANSKTQEFQAVKAGKPQTEIVVGKDASERTKGAAETLAEYLQYISGAKFVIEEGDGSHGIAIGLPGDFPDVPSVMNLSISDPTLREDYVLASHKNGIYLLGATELAVEHAVWDLLSRWGYRQYFPGKAWEVIPDKKDLTISVDTHEHPDYLVRRIWYGYGPWDYASEPYQKWCQRNRMAGCIQLNTGHSYDGIIHRNEDEFKAHPEYLGLVGGVRKSTKLCISNPNVRQLVIEDARRQLEKGKARDSVSTDPSDGLGWCECENCQALGSVSDRALTLANAVAEAINDPPAGLYVGMYAYSAHSPPPSIKVHPQVIISVATAFIRGGFTVEELLEGWNDQGATLGIREYYSVNTWDRDLPGRSRGSNLDYLQRTVPEFHQLGARYLSSESSDNWGPNGLGYYFASRMLWDIDEADRRDEIVSEFLQNCFGPAADTMAEYYELIDGSKKSLFSDDLVGRMYRLLAKARSQAKEAKIQERLNHLILYTRYLELWLNYSSTAGEERQENFEQLIRHAYRMRETMMVHTKGLYRDLVNRDKSVTIPADAVWSKPEPDNPWKSSEPFSTAELDNMVKQGIEGRKLRPFDPVSFSSDLVPVEPLNFKELKAGSTGIYSRGIRTIYTKTTEANQEITLNVKGGIIYQNRGNASIILFPADLTAENPLDEAEVPPDGMFHEVSLKAPKPGLYRVVVSDKGCGTKVEWPENLPQTIVSSLDQPSKLYGRWSMVFYVPKGTKVIGGFSNGPGSLLNPEGDKAHIFESKQGYFNVKVPAGMDGKLWTFDRCAGSRLLMTVPPSLAPTADQLLLPEEVVETDAP